MPTRLLLAMATAILLAAPASLPAADAPADSVTSRVFGQRPLTGIDRPTRIDYAYAHNEPAAGAATTAPVHMDIGLADAAGSKPVHFEMFEGQARRSFGPVDMTSQNPLVIVFLQRDVSAMERETGGAQHYFRNRLRAAFNEPAEVQTVELRVADQRVTGQRIVIQPFITDQRLDRFPRLKAKTYEFVMADAVPGGVYRLATQVSDPQTGALLVEESMTFAAATPAIP